MALEVDMAFRQVLLCLQRIGSNQSHLHIGLLQLSNLLEQDSMMDLSKESEELYIVLIRK